MHWLVCVVVVVLCPVISGVITVVVVAWWWWGVVGCNCIVDASIFELVQRVLNDTLTRLGWCVACDCVSV